MYFIKVALTASQNSSINEFLTQPDSLHFVSNVYKNTIFCINYVFIAMKQLLLIN